MTPGHLVKQGSCVTHPSPGDAFKVVIQTHINIDYIPNLTCQGGEYIKHISDSYHLNYK